MDMQLPNKVYNKLKVHSMMENKRSTRHTEKKEHSTAVSIAKCLSFTNVNA